MTQQAISEQVFPITSPAARLAPVVRELPADLETPTSVYLKLAGNGPSFLLESVAGGERLARYSFIGVNPDRAYMFYGRRLRTKTPEGVVETVLPDEMDPLDYLRTELARRPALQLPGLPRFSGGLAGYLGYDLVRYFEPSVALEMHAELPDAIFLVTDTLVAFDHAFGKMLLIANPDMDKDEYQARREAEEHLDAVQDLLMKPIAARQPARGIPAASTEMQSNQTRAQFMERVEKAKQHIVAGDIFQVVLSQRLSRQTHAAPFDIYRSLRRLNPSPYMYFFDFDGLTDEPLRVIGASPEMHVRLEGQQATIRPIAGTRPRGKTLAEDTALEKDLLADPKECAEHVMLVDLARNDLGRVSRYGSVHVTELMGIERYSHVMHIVSQVEGSLRPEYDAFNLMRATFPAGTVSGAPKIRAMQIIRDLEGKPRGPYAGAAGYFAYDGSMDTCITIRTIIMQGKQVSIQAGAGIIADSVPETEYQETLNKARALAVAVEMAEKDNLPLDEKKHDRRD